MQAQSQLQNYSSAPIRVEVTQEDINNGSRFDPYNCAISLAMRRLGYIATVGLSTVDLKSVGRFQLPVEAEDFILKFDAPMAWGEPEPVTFELRLQAS